MDLKHLDTPPSDDERAAVDAVLGPDAPSSAPTPWAEAEGRRTQLLPTLVSLQSRIGWVSAGGLGYACRRLGVPPAEGYGVASFYALLSLAPRAEAFAHVCDDLACHLAGADAICDRLGETLGPSARAPHRAGGDAGEARARSHPPRWARSPCLGLCAEAPAAMISRAGQVPEERAFGGATAARIEAALRGETTAEIVTHLGGKGPRRLLARAGVVDPQSLDAYRASGGYEALRKAVAQGADFVVGELSSAKLVGRGGAAFPTARKWEAVRRAPARPRYVVCNADESEPGTFKDRVLLERDPFAVIEAMTIAGYVTGAERGYLYLRGEYPLASERIAHALGAARASGLLGADVMGAGFTFDVELRRGAGAYICGEETALFASIEGLRGEPRNKPPYPVHAGLFGKPTAVNNVETLVATLDIVRDGADTYARVGTPDSPGTKLFCLSGRVAAPGVYEVPFGTPLAELIALGGGVPDGRAIRAVLLGGAAGVFVGPEQLGVPLSFEHTRAAGLTLGSGVVMVFDDRDALPPVLRRLAAFFRDESCGQCVPCRAGTVRQEELLSRLVRKEPLGSVERELETLRELGQAMRDASICGLGQTASSAIESALALAPFEEP